MKIIKENGKRIFNAKAVALVGIMAATLECGKLVLATIPNVEVVTLLCALYGYVFGWLGVLAAAIFVCLEPLIWGVGSWIITYIIYWPSVALIFMLLSRKGIKNRLVFTVTAVVMTLLFGVISSMIDSAFYLGINENYFKNLVIFYARGSVFYIVQIVTNAAVFPTVFPFLVKKLSLFKPQLDI